MTDKESDKLNHTLEHLDKDIQDLDTTLEKSLKANGVLPTLTRGIVGALGAAIGASLIIGFVVYLLQILALAPYIGDVFELLLEQLQQNK